MKPAAKTACQFVAFFSLGALLYVAAGFVGVGCYIVGCAIFDAALAVNRWLKTPEKTQTKGDTQ